MWHFYSASIIWTLAGLFGFAVRLGLLIKFRTDFALALNLHLNGLRRSVTSRALESAIVQCLLNLGVVVVGIASMTQPPGPSVDRTAYSFIVTVFLVLIPCVLAFDAARELTHQWKLIRAINITHRR